MAVIADLDTGRTQVGSGYLVADRRVLTAWHCTVDKRTGRPARSLRVIRRSDGAEAPATLLAAALDVAILEVSGEAAWTALEASEQPQFGRVVRGRTGELVGCEAVGFPLWQLDPRDQHRDAAELHGTIRVTESEESGLLVMRDPMLDNVTAPASATTDAQTATSPWGGLSGALVFYRDFALGVVIEHHPRQGASAITILPVERFVEDPTGRDLGIAAVTIALGLASADEESGFVHLAELTEVQVPDQVPQSQVIISHQVMVASLTGFRRNLRNDCLPFVPPASGAPEHPEVLFDSLVEQAGHRGVLLVAPAGAGKTRTCFEVGNRAVAAGWDVLHVPPGEPMATAADIADAILASGPRVLLLFDYLNESGIEPAAIRHRLMPQAAARGRSSQSWRPCVLDGCSPRTRMSTTSLTSWK